MEEEGRAPRIGARTTTQLVFSLALISVVIAVVSAAISVISLLTPTPSVPPNGVALIGRLDAQLPSSSIGGNLSGPAAFSVIATPAAKCNLTVNNETSYKSVCRSFAYVYEFEETIEFTLEVELPANVSELFFEATIGATNGVEGLNLGAGIFSHQAAMVAMPPARNRAVSSDQPTREDRVNGSLSQPNPVASFTASFRDFANIVVNSSATLEITISVSLTTRVVVRGDECRGVTEIRIYREISADLDIEITVELSDPEQFGEGVTVEVLVFGPEARFN